MTHGHMCSNPDRKGVPEKAAKGTTSMPPRVPGKAPNGSNVISRPAPSGPRRASRNPWRGSSPESTTKPTPPAVAKSKKPPVLQDGLPDREVTWTRACGLPLRSCNFETRVPHPNGCVWFEVHPAFNVQLQNKEAKGNQVEGAGC